MDNHRAPAMINGYNEEDSFKRYKRDAAKVVKDLRLRPTDTKYCLELIERATTNAQISIALREARERL